VLISFPPFADWRERVYELSISRIRLVPWGPRSVYPTGAWREASSSGLNGWASHTFAVLSALPVTIRDPSGLNDAE
jgi:hypothetical protein